MTTIRRFLPKSARRRQMAEGVETSANLGRCQELTDICRCWPSPTSPCSPSITDDRAHRLCEAGRLRLRRSTDTSTALARWTALLTAGLVAIAFVFSEGAVSAPAKAAPQTFRDCPDCPLMTVVPAGRFVIGSPQNEPGRTAQEGPQHNVAIRHAFAVATYDVSRAEFETFAAEAPNLASGGRCEWRAPKAGGILFDQGPSDPVVCVSWNDAKAFAAWLRRKTGKPYRLLSESEWEYAARAGSVTARPWGNEASREFANVGTEPCCGPFAEGRDRWLYTSPAGRFAPNRFGLFDMIGNVWQWVEDCASDGYTRAPSHGEALTSGDCDRHIARGGSWFHDFTMARSASRVADQADFRIADIGFRVARDL